MTANDGDSGGAAAPRQPARPSKFGPVTRGPSFDRDKLCWHEHILADPRLRATAKVVAGLIMHDLNAERGYAWRSQSSIAITIGYTERTVQTAIAQLRRLSYIKVSQIAGGSNHYVAVIPSPGPPTVAKEISGAVASGANAASSLAVAEAKAPSPADEAGFRVDSLGKPLEPAPASPAEPYDSSSQAVDEGAFDEADHRDRWSAAAIRELALRVADAGWVYSYLEHSAFDEARGEIIPWSETAAKRISERLGKELPQTGWTICPVLPVPHRDDRSGRAKRTPTTRRWSRGERSSKWAG